MNVGHLAGHIRSTLRSFGLMGPLGGCRHIYHRFLDQRLNVSKGASPYSVRPRNSRHPLWCRPGTSDAFVFHEVFVLQDYRFLNDVRDVRLIVDCGANVGYTSAYLLTRFSEARLVAVEPDSDNFEMLKKNLESFGSRVKLVNAGVWSRTCGLKVVHSRNAYAEWTIAVRECREGEPIDVAGVGIETLLADSGEREIAILKIDVEGSEIPLFSSNYEPWIERVNNLIIELHGPEYRKVFDHAMAGRPFDISCHQKGEMTIAVCKRKTGAVSR